jgi:rod shape-determining protein MreC
MPLGTLDRTPPPFFKQGQSALSKLLLFSALAVFLMVADARFQLAKPLRSAIATALTPMQWLAMRPVQALQKTAGYFDSLQDAQSSETQAREKLALQAQRASQVELLALENERLRKLLELRSRSNFEGKAAQVLYDAADPYTRRIVIDKGAAQGVEPGSPVIDEGGVLGQVTRVHPLVSEVALVIDRDQAIPVLNTRTGARSVAFGDPLAYGGTLELRFMGGNADVQVGDLLVTSGIDGVYPAGLPVAKVDKVERRADSAFAKIYCTPQAQVHAARHVLVVTPQTGQQPPRPEDDKPATPAKKGGRK